MDNKENRFLSVVYQLYTDHDGKNELEEQTDPEQPFTFITGFGIALDTFEEQLSKVEKGEKFDITIKPYQAFGDHDPEHVHKVERDIFMVDGKFDKEHIFEGAIIKMSDNEGHDFMAKVAKIEQDGVTIDLNHPLAGKTLNFKGEMLENRIATEEEVQDLIKFMTGGCGHKGCGGGGCGEGNCGGSGCGEGECGEGCGCGNCH